MRATEILTQEHRIIEQALSALEGMATLAVQEHRFDEGHGRQAVSFIRGYADKFHHAKEEDLLFGEMEAAGMSRQGGPLAVMLHEHEVGRALVGRMDDAIDQVVAGNQEGLQVFSDSAIQFAAMLRGHIQKEDSILYPMADNILSQASQERLIADFARVEEAQGGKAASDDFVSTATMLAGLYATLAPQQGYASANEADRGHLG